MDGRTRSRRSLSVRGRILTAVLVTTAIGMLSAGGISYLIARKAVYQGIEQALVQQNDQIHTVAEIARDGQSGRPITGPGDVLYLAIRSSVPDPREGIVGLVDGRVEWVPDPGLGSGSEFQRSLAADRALIAAATAVGPADSVTVHSLSTALHPRLAFISVPVRVDGSASVGHYLAVVDVGAYFRPVNRTHLTLAVICLVALAVVGAVGYQVAGRLLAPLRALRRTAQRINDADLTDRIPEDQLSSNDEVADLGRTMNAMLDRLAGSFDNQRRLLDDAGHELRTPITIVRGHLELLDAHNPREVAETRDLALDELDRMQRLVDDIMVLAKARRPDFVRPEPIVVSALLAGVLEKIAPLAQRNWFIEASTDAVAMLDRQRITQALVQLVANALRFTTDGSEIALGGRLIGTELRLWVRDEGTGIPPEARPRIFERFGRESNDRVDVSDDNGAGLGLAIVAAIARAHHGRVAMASTVGSGSTFSLCLPGVVADPPPAEAAGTEPTTAVTRHRQQPASVRTGSSALATLRSGGPWRPS
ncbi:MAG TPA: HAMP domain-containing sensor histidine kinase [Propionibacteriaceae bacterium]|nr:HAMP domain-containing sensor histidine kinase [Propionibacteriaceae bacterium]